MANIQHLLESQPEPRAILTQLGRIAATHKKEVYVVGGVVRDLFLNRPLKEIDLMVVGDGIKFAKIIAKEMAIKKVVPFPKFSTAHIPATRTPILPKA